MLTKKAKGQPIEVYERTQRKLVESNDSFKNLIQQRKPKFIDNNEDHENLELN